MRLDLFLKVSRVCPRRSVAQKLCDAGFVLLNGRPAKPGHAVKVGDVIALRRPDRETEFRVRTVPGKRNVSKQDSGALIEVLNEKQLEPLSL